MFSITFSSFGLWMVIFLGMGIGATLIWAYFHEEKDDESDRRIDRAIDEIEEEIDKLKRL